MNKRSEKSFVFHSKNDRQLFGIIHYPDNQNMKTGILYIHPFGEERNLSHRISVNVARNLASKGYAVMRFDLSGCGDSYGELNNFTIEDWLEDISASVRHFTSLLGLDKCILWGLRFGAFLALHSAANIDQIAGMILWQPIHDSQTYFHQFMRYKFSSQLISGSLKKPSLSSLIKKLHSSHLVNIMGYPISLELYNSIINRPNIDSNSILKVPILILSISLLSVAGPSILATVNLIKNGNIKVDFKHIMDEPFWDRPWRYDSLLTEQATIEWVQEYFPLTP